MKRVDATIIDSDDRESSVSLFRDNERFLLPAAALTDAIGWTLKPEGLCRGDRCIPNFRLSDLTEPDPAADDKAVLVDLGEVARVTGQPFVLDVDESIAALGVSAGDRAARLTSLDAAPFTVADIDGESVELADFRGRKKLLVAFASW